MNFRTLIGLTLLLGIFSCKETPQEKTLTKKVVEKNVSFKNKGHELVYNMLQKVGDYKTLRDKKDVIYTCTYQTPNEKIDISTEKYIFDGEYSYGKYIQHERTSAKLKGIVEQGYDGKEYWLKHNNNIVNDQKLLKRVAFKRPTNFYWFAMMQKLLDPGLHYDYLGNITIDHQDYDIVKVTFTSTNDKPTDIYQLYINKKTFLVDQFLFTVADYGKMEIPKLMQLEYTKVDNLLIPSIRRYKASTWEATVTEAPWTQVNWTDIKFNNGLIPEDFKK